MKESLCKLFESCFKEPAGEITALNADGSNRKLFRLKSPKRAAIGVTGPDAKENRAFLEFSRHFRSIGLSVPEIYAQDLKKGIYLEEDLGDTTLFQFLMANRAQDKIPESVLTIYEKAVACLPRFQIEAAKTFNDQFCYPRASFDKQSMLWDLNHFKYYFLQLANIPFDEQALEMDFDRFADFLLEAKNNFFLYRDFQSRNIMIKNGNPWFIDYQGGRRGALQYDIASLLFDAKADLPFDFREKLLEGYLKKIRTLTTISEDEFMRHYWGFVLIRIMQAMGAYGLRGFYERKSHFLQSIPYAIRNLEFLLRQAKFPVKLPALMGVIKRLVHSSYLRQFGKAHPKLTVRVQSFSYKEGVPQDETPHGGGYVFDCRALPNPGRLKEFEKLTGKDRAVISYLQKEPAVGDFLNHIFALIGATIENYKSRNFTDLMAAFGCTGGLHRSVYCAEFLAKTLKEKYKVDIEIRHRALEKDA